MHSILFFGARKVYIYTILSYGQETFSSGTMECRPFKDQSYDKALAEQEIGIQSVPSLKDVAAQTIQLALNHIFTYNKKLVFRIKHTLKQ